MCPHERTHAALLTEYDLLQAGVRVSVSAANASRPPLLLLLLFEARIPLGSTQDCIFSVSNGK